MAEFACKFDKIEHNRSLGLLKLIYQHEFIQTAFDIEVSKHDLPILRNIFANINNNRIEIKNDSSCFSYVNGEFNISTCYIPAIMNRHNNTDISILDKVIIVKILTAILN